MIPMTLYHPTEPHQIQTRNQLLQSSLRPDPLPFSIESEYPIVLDREDQAYSYCWDFDGQLCSHANLWPRKLIHGSRGYQVPIGLVGNVATNPLWRGHGHMRSMLAAIEELGRHQGLSSLILWSDLSSFYQKLGFQSLGKEFHFHFVETNLPCPQKSSAQLVKINKNHVTLSELQCLLDLRYPLELTLKRSPEEFQSLLAIPWLDLWVAISDSSLIGYAMIGKGYDMIGVIHEWGALEPVYLIDLIHQIRRDKALKQCLLLAPHCLETSWYKALVEEAYAVETQAMALIKELGQASVVSDLENLFIWGLDSI